MAELISNVIEKGFCIGCGVCTVVKGNRFKNKMNKFGMYQLSIEDFDEESIDKSVILKQEKICPFYNGIDNEDYWGKELFGNYKDINFSDKIGYWLKGLAGYINNEEKRLTSSSGGLTTWLLETLFKNGKIDSVIHVSQSSNDAVLFKYSISNSIEEISSGAKTRYYPVTLSEVLPEVLESKKKYAIVGVPCFIKALRNLCKQIPEYGINLKYFIGILCGHLKSIHFSSLFAWQNGIHPEDIKSIDFRAKTEGKDAGRYHVTLENKENNKIINTKPASCQYGTNWGYGFFKYKACDYCDDVLSETADIVFGDAWIDKFKADWKGHNIVIIRNPSLYDYFIEGKNKNEISLEDISTELIIGSQAASFRHRREGLSIRLNQLEKKNLWHPPKRVMSNDYTIQKTKKNIYQSRIKLSKKSHRFFYQALKLNVFLYFKLRMLIPIMNYKIARNGMKVLVPVFIKNMLKKIFNLKK